MAQSLFFQRDTKVYLEVPNSTTGTTIWEIPVQDGFSFSQSTNSSEVSIQEFSDGSNYSRRGRRAYTDSLSPVEWSFSTYNRPFKAATGTAYTLGNHYSTDFPLWSWLFGAMKWNPTDKKFIDGTATTPNDITTSSATSLSVKSDYSDVLELGKFSLYFVMGTGTTRKVYHLQDAVMNEASTEFDIADVTMTSWSGFATAIEVDPSAITNIDTYFENAISEGINLSSNFIRNRMSTLSLSTKPGTPTADALSSDTYSIILTGGNITASNNIEFVTPNEMSNVNVPVGHFAGTRAVSGSFTAYLSVLSGTATSSTFWEEMSSEATGLATNQFNLQFQVGGADAAPGLVFAMPNCHVEIPSINVEDAIALETNFMALGDDVTTANEISLVYKGA